MQLIQFPFKKSIWLLLPLAITILTLFSISSCKEKKFLDDELKSMTVHSVILTRDAITETWETNSELEKIDHFTFYSSYDYEAKEFKVFVQANDIDNKQIGKIKKLEEKNSSDTTISFVGLGRNNIKMANLKIYTPGSPGKLEDFKNIRLTPEVYIKKADNSNKADNSEYLAFRITVTSDTAPPREVDEKALPCPPCMYCLPPCKIPEPSDATSTDNPIIDTTGGK